ncbi:hypothetical protein [Polaribacter sp. SA4-10]|nr:hypothetical protein [Polaribacter sp. SA4-10]
MRKIINILLVLTLIGCNSQKKEQRQQESNQKEKDKTIVKPK